MGNVLAELGSWVLRLDIAGFHLVNHAWTTPLLDWVMPLMTCLGLGHVQLVLLLGLYVLGGRAGRRTALLCVLAFAVSGIAAQILKAGFERPRPVHYVPDCRFLIGKLYWGSFPSGHTATSFAIAMVAGMRHRRWLVPLLVVALLVGYSRLYVGVHFPTDVLAGALVGIATGFACLEEDRRILARRKREAAPMEGAEAGREAEG